MKIDKHETYFFRDHFVRTARILGHYSLFWKKPSCKQKRFLCSSNQSESSISESAPDSRFTLQKLWGHVINPCESGSELSSTRRPIGWSKADEESISREDSVSEIVYGGNYESEVRVLRKPIGWWRKNQKSNTMRRDCSLTVFDEDSDYKMDPIHNPTDWSETNQKLTRTLSGLFTVVSIENHGSRSMKYSRQNLIGWLARDQKPATKESDSGCSSRGGSQVQDLLDLESNQLPKHQSNIDLGPSNLSRFLSQFTIIVNYS